MVLQNCKDKLERIYDVSLNIVFSKLVVLVAIHNIPAQLILLSIMSS